MKFAMHRDVSHHDAMHHACAPTVLQRTATNRSMAAFARRMQNPYSLPNNDALVLLTIWVGVGGKRSAVKSMSLFFF
jgi:hypothetical protein